MTAPLRRASAPAIAVLLVLAIFSSGAAAASPKLDPSFGAGGRARPVYGPAFDGTRFPAGKVEAEGSLLVNRQDSENGEGAVTVERYLSDGRLDPSFKTEGKSEVPEAVDGRGRTLRTERREAAFTIERLNPDGSVDEAFGCDSHLGFCHSIVDFNIEAILPLPSGKIVVAGSIGRRRESDPLPPEVALACFDESGAFDPSFGKNGEVHLTTDDGLKFGELVGLTLGPDEDVLVSLNDEAATEASSWTPVGGSRVAAFGTTGQLDPGFGTAGVVASEDHIGAVEGLAGGGLLIAGEHYGPKPKSTLNQAPTAVDISLTRLTPAGAPDPSFGAGDGTTVVDLGGIDLATALLLRPDGSIVVGGATTVPRLRCVYPREPTCTETPVLLGFDAAGALAPGFGEVGVLKLERLRFEAAGVSAVGVLFLQDLPGGGVVAGGGTQADGFLAETDPGGRLLPGFGEDGIVAVTHPHRSSARPRQIATDPEGRLVVLGETDSGGVADPVPAVFRLHPEGRVDRSFGDGRGFVTFSGSLIAMTLDRRGEALVMTGKYSPNSLTRVTASGGLDLRFGSEGVAPLPERVPGVVRGGRHVKLDLYLRTVTALPGGGILVTAVSGGAKSARLDLIRLTSDGALDRSFGRGGIRQLSFPGVGVPLVRATKLTADGRVVLGGSVRARGPGGKERQTAAVFRLTADGRPDPTFGNAGLVTFPQRGQGLITALALGPRGEIVVGGRHTMQHMKWRPLLERLSPTGKPDRAFARRAAAAGAGDLGAWATEPARMLLWGGRIVMVPYYSQPYLPIYAADGSLEQVLGFGKTRHPSTSIGGATLQRGALVVASKTAHRRTFTLSRLLP